MCKFDLDDELRRGGTGLLAQAVASLWKMRFREQPYAALNEEAYAQAWLYARQQEAAAVPADNQAKAPTALDEMRARSMTKLVESRLETISKRQEMLTAWSNMSMTEQTEFWYEADALTHGEEVARLRKDLTESREALATQQARANQLAGQLEVVTQGLTEARELLEEWGAFGATVTGCTNHSGRIAIEDAKSAMNTHVKVTHCLVDTQRQRTEVAEVQLTESREALARVEAERDDLADCARNAEVARRHLGETLGMMHEPSMGPAWPASWDALVEQVREMMGSVGAHVELGETTEKLAWMTTDRDEWKEAAEEVATELRKRDAVVLEISAAWSRYQRNDMSREEFEGTVAERIESYISQAASEAEVTERAIVVGSTWEHIGPERWGIVAVESLGGRKVCYSSERVSGCRDEAFFRASFTWVSDPEATDSATKETT